MFNQVNIGFFHSQLQSLLY